MLLVSSSRISDFEALFYLVLVVGVSMSQEDRCSLFLWHAGVCCLQYTVPTTQQPTV